jgi:hypothetical protein
VTWSRTAARELEKNFLQLLELELDEQQYQDYLEKKYVGLTEAFARAWAPQWRTFLTRERMAAVPEHLEEVIAALRAFLMPLAERALSEQKAFNTST